MAFPLIPAQAGIQGVEGETGPRFRWDEGDIALYQQSI